MTLIVKYEDETGKQAIVKPGGQHMKITDDYIEWLEIKLNKVYENESKLRQGLISIPQFFKLLED